MSHRIRAAMADIPEGQLGGGGKVVEADETYWGKRKGFKAFPQGYEHKQKIFSLVERGGKVRSFHVANVTGETLKPILAAHVDAATMINTDEHGAYSKLNRHFAGHEKVSHSVREYARRTPQGLVTTNTAGGFFSILKRGLNGIYHHVSEQYLQRYVTEFDFRYNNREALGVDDNQRAEQVAKQIAREAPHLSAD